MCKKSLISVLVLLLAGCMSAPNPPKDQAAIDSCNDKGGKAYWRSETGKVEKCLFPRDLERLAKLELACVSAGSTVIYDDWRLYSNCQRGNPEVKVKVINNNTPQWEWDPGPTICISKRCKERQKNQ